MELKDMLLVKQDTTDLIFLMKKDKHEMMNMVMKEKQEMMKITQRDKEHLLNMMESMKKDSQALVTMITDNREQLSKTRLELPHRKKQRVESYLHGRPHTTDRHHQHTAAHRQFYDAPLTNCAKKTVRPACAGLFF